MITAGDDIQTPGPLLARLADGHWHTPDVLAGELDAGSADLAGALEQLTGLGVTIEHDRARGYRLPAPVDLLDGGAIRAQLPERAAARLDGLLIRQSVDSTNTWLREYRDGRTRAALAECQTAGRGQAGRPWVSPFGANLHLSVGDDLALGPAALGALPLAIGVAVSEALLELGVTDIALKWPNDLWIGEAKLGGILVEARTVAAGRTRLVVGLGLNIAMPSTAAAAIDQAWTRLADRLSPLPSRNEIAARCLAALLRALEEFEQHGFEVFAPRWPRFDLLAGRAVRVAQAGADYTAIARGVAADGSLLLDVDGVQRAVHSGDVRLRPGPPVDAGYGQSMS